MTRGGGQVLLRRRLGRIPTAAVASTTGRTLVAALVGALAAAGVIALIPWDGLAPLGRAWLQLVVALVVMAPITLVGLRLLREHEGDEIPVHVVYPDGRHPPPKLRAFLDALVPRLRQRCDQIAKALS